MTLGSAAAAGVRLIAWCKDCRHQVEPDPAEMAVPYGAGTTATHWPLTNPLKGRRAETHDQRAVESEDSGDKRRKELFDAFVAPFTLAPSSKNRIRGLRGGSYEPDQPLARVDVQPGNVGRDCPCGADLSQMRTSI
jgi:hypothetical protein